MSKHYKTVNTRINEAFLKGFLMGQATQRKSICLDYGFGPKGLGTYIYHHTKVVFFKPDK